MINLKNNEDRVKYYENLISNSDNTTIGMLKEFIQLEKSKTLSISDYMKLTKMIAKAKKNLKVESC